MDEAAVQRLWRQLAVSDLVSGAWRALSWRDLPPRAKQEFRQLMREAVAQEGMVVVPFAGKVPRVLGPGGDDAA